MMQKTVTMNVSSMVAPDHCGGEDPSVSGQVPWTATSNQGRDSASGLSAPAGALWAVQTGDSQGVAVGSSFIW